VARGAGSSAKRERGAGRDLLLERLPVISIGADDVNDAARLPLGVTSRTIAAGTGVPAHAGASGLSDDIRAFQPIRVTKSFQHGPGD